MDKTYFQQFLPKETSKSKKRKKKDKKEEKKEEKKAKKAKKHESEEEGGVVEWDNVFFEDELDDINDDPVVEEKDDDDYNPSYDEDYKPYRVCTEYWQAFGYKIAFNLLKTNQF